MSNLKNFYSNAKVKHYWDAKNQKNTVKLQPGEFFVTDEDVLLTTVLGSCIAVCVYDPKLKIAGMNHFMLPEVNDAGHSKEFMHRHHQAALRYGNWAMEELLNNMFKKGAERERIVFKIFGGSRLFDSTVDIGAKNINYI